MKLIFTTLTSMFFATYIHAQSPEENVQAVLDAARQLTFSGEGNRPFLLIKTLTIRSPVALIFGYADNEAGCNELAKDLSQAAVSRGLKDPALFVCDAVY